MQYAEDEEVVAGPATEGGEEALEGAIQIHWACGAPHEPCQSTDWQL